MEKYINFLKVYAVVYMEEWHLRNKGAVLKEAEPQPSNSTVTVNDLPVGDLAFTSCAAKPPFFFFSHSENSVME